MKRRFLVKMLGVVLAGVLACAPLTVMASGSSGSSSGSVSPSDHSSSKDHSSGGGAGTTSAPSTQSSTVVTGGKAVSSSVGGSYTATNVNGTAVIADKGTVNAAFGIKPGETATVVVRNSKCGDAAMNSFNATVSALALNAGPVIDFSAVATATGGSRIVGSLSQAIPVVVGIPAGMQNPNLAFAMIRVVPGGQVDILFDTDADPSTVTFNNDKSGAFMLVSGTPEQLAAIAAALTA